MWYIVWVSAQGQRSVSVSHHFLLQASQCPCSVRKRFSRDHCCRERSKPACRIVGSHSRWELTTWADFQLCIHWLLMSTGCKSSLNGFLDVSCSHGGQQLVISGWIGELSCLTIFSTSLSVAPFLRRAGGSMLESTGSHRTAVERSGTRDQTHATVQLHIDPTCLKTIMTCHTTKWAWQVMFWCQEWHTVSPWYHSAICLCLSKF